MNSNIPESALEQIKADLRGGRKIAAIKRLRDATGMGLADAKNAVENLHAELHARDPATYPALSAPSARGCFTLLVAILLIGGAVLAIVLLRR